MDQPRPRVSLVLYNEGQWSQRHEISGVTNFSVSEDSEGVVRMIADGKEVAVYSLEDESWRSPDLPNGMGYKEFRLKVAGKGAW